MLKEESLNDGPTVDAKHPPVVTGLHEEKSLLKSLQNYRGQILFGVTLLLLLYRWNLQPVNMILIVVFVFWGSIRLLSTTNLFSSNIEITRKSSTIRSAKITGFLLAVILTFLVISSLIFLNVSPQPGGDPIMFDSPNFEDGAFQNLEEFDDGNTSWWGTLGEFMVSDSKRAPTTVLPTMEYQSIELNDGEISITWFGHSTILIETTNVTIITDPLFGEDNTDPLFFGPSPFPYEHPYSLSELPQIDHVFISHDHYDHLDMDTIKELSDSTFFVPLGVKSHLLRWGITDGQVSEFDWYEEANITDEFQVALTPAQHFSGRGLMNMDSTLWGSWVFELEDSTLYFSGDTGYMEEFKTIGERYGPFDIAFLESGQYDIAWKDVHMFPDEVVQAAIYLNAMSVLPIHNSKFELALHPWEEPLELVTSIGSSKNISVTTPMIGETFLLNQPHPDDEWWLNVSVGTPSFLKTNPLVGVALAPLNLVGIVWIVAGRQAKRNMDDSEE